MVKDLLTIILAEFLSFSFIQSKVTVNNIHRLFSTERNQISNAAEFLGTLYFYKLKYCKV